MSLEPSPTRAYRGDDRRGVIAQATSQRSRPFVVAGLILLITFASVLWAAASPDARTALDLQALRPELDTAALALAVVTGTLAVIRWRLVGDAPALWIGTAILIYGVCTIGLGDVVSGTRALGVDTAVLAWLRPASVLVTIALFTRSLFSPEVDARLDGTATVTLSFAAVTLLTLLLQALPGVGDALVGAAELVPAGSRSTIAAAALAILWAVVATSFAWRGLRREHQLSVWMSTLLFGLTLSELARALVMSYGAGWLAGASLLRTVAILLGLIGIMRELQAVFAAQTSRLFDSHADFMVSEARLRRHIAEQEERAHEARNALTAIEGATLTLERHRDQLDESSKEALSRAVTSEISRLQRLVSGAKPPLSYRITFDVDEVVEGQVALARAQGARVITDLDGGRAVGRPAGVAEALQNLLTNARVHASDTTVVVTSAHAENSIIVRVLDRGPGVPNAFREGLFARGTRASTTAPGSGLGLFVSRQLMRDQGGDVWFEQPPGGGACFALRMPAAQDGLAGDDVRISELIDEPADRRDVADGHLPFAQTGTDPSDARTAQGRRQLDHHPDLDSPG